MKSRGNADGEEDETDEGQDVQAFNDKEIKLIKENLKYKRGKDNTFTIAIRLDLITGIRLGELLGLKKKFVLNNLIKVRNTLKRIKVFETSKKWRYEIKLIRPKSKTSIRSVYYPTNFYIILKEYFAEQEEKWKNNGLEFNDDSLIFTTNSCKPIDSKNFSRAWKRFLKKIKVEYKKPHSLRDTYATTLVRRGAKIHDVKAMLGHSTIKITEKYYIFVFPEDKTDTANLIKDLAVM